MKMIVSWWLISFSRGLEGSTSHATFHQMDTFIKERSDKPSRWCYDRVHYLLKVFHQKHTHTKKRIGNDQCHHAIPVSVPKPALKSSSEPEENKILSLSLDTKWIRWKMLFKNRKATRLLISNKLLFFFVVCVTSFQVYGFIRKSVGFS